MSKDTGGPAFPTVLIGKPEGGMTLRDYFAAKAMQALIQKLDTRKNVATAAYGIADAMLETRK